MDQMKFTKEDKDKVTEFLNLIGKHAEFKVNTSELISMFKLLAHMQQAILPKIDSHILEVIKVVESKEKK